VSLIPGDLFNIVRHFSYTEFIVGCCGSYIILYDYV